jgi:hypothetical protein
MKLDTTSAFDMRGRADWSTWIALVSFGSNDPLSDLRFVEFSLLTINWSPPSLQTVGVMGNALQTLNDPQSCFNGQNNWSLGWFDDRSVETDPLYPSLFKIAAFVDYGKASVDQYVVVRVKDTSSLLPLGPIYLQYNRAKDFNIGTREGADSLTVVREKFQDGTELLAKLDATTTTYKEQVGFHDLVIVVCNSFTGSDSSPDFLVVSVAYDKSLCGSSFTLMPTPFPSTAPTPTPVLLTQTPFQTPPPSPELVISTNPTYVRRTRWPTLSPSIAPLQSELLTPFPTSVILTTFLTEAPTAVRNRLTTNNPTNQGSSVIAAGIEGSPPSKIEAGANTAVVASLTILACFLAGILILLFFMMRRRRSQETEYVFNDIDDHFHEAKIVRITLDETGSTSSSSELNRTFPDDCSCTKGVEELQFPIEEGPPNERQNPATPTAPHDNSDVGPIGMIRSYLFPLFTVP